MSDKPMPKPLKQWKRERIPVGTRMAPRFKILYGVLSDGLAHTQGELVLHLDPDGLLSYKVLGEYISALRVRLPAGYGIIMETRGKRVPPAYRMVRLIGKAAE